MSKLWRRCKRICRYYYLRVLRVDLPAEAVARGVAIGVFVGCLPILPFHTFTALGLAFVLRASKLASVLCTFFVNPLTMVPFYALLFQIGKLFIPGADAVELNYEFNMMKLMQAGLETGWDYFKVMLVGGLIIGIPASLLAYFVTCRIIIRYRARKAAYSLSSSNCCTGRKHLKDVS